MGDLYCTYYSLVIFEHKFLTFIRQPFDENSASHPCIRREILDACMQIGRWMAACYHPEIVPGAMRHGQARSWLRARAGSRAASARTRASQWLGPAAARGAPVRIDFAEQNRRASDRAAAKMAGGTVVLQKKYLNYSKFWTEKIIARVFSYRPTYS